MKIRTTITPVNIVPPDKNIKPGNYPVKKRQNITSGTFHVVIIGHHGTDVKKKDLKLKFFEIEAVPKTQKTRYSMSQSQN
jgi:hypothetical protein